LKSPLARTPGTFDPLPYLPYLSCFSAPASRLAPVRAVMLVHSLAIWSCVDRRGCNRGNANGGIPLLRPSTEPTSFLRRQRSRGVEREETCNSRTREGKYARGEQGPARSDMPFSNTTQCDMLDCWFEGNLSCMPPAATRWLAGGLA
jgi:hypothetical protein